jgi:putative ABC transport system permease protein
VAEPVGRSRLRLLDLLGESVAGIVQRPARTALTTLGTVLGVGAFSAILGLTATASGQVSKDFTVLSATQVTVKDVGDPRAVQTQRTLNDFPAGSDLTIGRLNGVVHAGVTWPVWSKQLPSVSAADTNADTHELRVDAASPGYLRALDPTMRSGVLYDSFHDNRQMRVAVLGSAAAAEIGISNLANSPAVFVNGTGYTVVGIIGDVARNPDTLLDVLIPEQTATALYGPPSIDGPPSMLIETRLGAAGLIAKQAPVALRPDRPSVLQAVPPPDAHQLQNAVTARLNSLFLLLAGVTLAIGAVGIANTTLVAVMERVPEIGLRRSLGARPRHIAAQFLAESTTLGTLGGLLGSALGITVTVTVALSSHWTAVLNPATTLPAPVIGTATGLVAGLYPALRAARIEPLEALHR